MSKFAAQAGRGSNTITITNNIYIYCYDKLSLIDPITGPHPREGDDEREFIIIM